MRWPFRIILQSRSCAGLLETPGTTALVGDSPFRQGVKRWNVGARAFFIVNFEELPASHEGTCPQKTTTCRSEAQKAASAKCRLHFSRVWTFLGFASVIDTRRVSRISIVI